MLRLLTAVFVALCSFVGYDCLYNRSFPTDFLFGVATSSYQIEGAWNVDGKGENVWDRYTHTYAYFTENNVNGDVACDSYHKYLEDVQNVKYLGVNYYRFSLSWARILPTGFANQINPAGVAYYNNLINSLLENGIQPMITIYHWDMAQTVSDLGGATSSTIRQYLKDLARVAFENFGDRVKYWITYNEPKNLCLKGDGYGSVITVAATAGIAEYLCSYNVLLSHADIYHMYNDEYKATQGGKITLVLDSHWYEAATESAEDLAAQERQLQFTFGWFANAVYHPNGNYPQIMIETIGNKSVKAGYRKSRLPTFTEDQIDYIKGTFDFLGLNTYTTYIVKALESDEADSTPSWSNDAMTSIYQSDAWESGASTWLKVVPWGLRKLLNWLKDTYNDPEIIITENGYCDKGGTEDQARINYYQEYLSALLESIHEDKVKVQAYTAWSLMDNFEWFSGYDEKFGLYSVDFEDDNRTRTAKASAHYYKQIVASKCLLETGNCITAE